MTDETQAAGSVQTGTPAAGTGTALEGSNSGAADPFAGLETGTREWVGTKGYKSIADIAKAAQNAESIIGRSVVLPDDKAKPEDWDKVFNRLGRPEKPDGYEFKLPQGVPEGMPYDAEFAKTFKGAAHAAGLTAKQATALHDFWTGEAVKAFTSQTAEAKKLQETATKRAVDATSALEKAYGGTKDSDPFKQGVDLAVRAIEGLDKLPGVSGIKQALEQAGLLVGGVVLEPSIAIALTHIGKTLFKEGDMPLGGSAPAGDNPFAGAGNMTLQMAMIRSDPEKARRMISAVGKTPADFHWDGKDVAPTPR